MEWNAIAFQIHFETKREKGASQGIIYTLTLTYVYSITNHYEHPSFWLLIWLRTTLKKAHEMPVYEINYSTFKDLRKIHEKARKKLLIGFGDEEAHLSIEKYDGFRRFFDLYVRSLFFVSFSKVFKSRIINFVNRHLVGFLKSRSQPN